MHRLTREVRFALNGPQDRQLAKKPANSFAGYPSLVGLHPHLALRVTLVGELDPASQYLCNIKWIDQAVRKQLIGAFTAADWIDPAKVFKALHNAFGTNRLDCVELMLSPYLSICQRFEEIGSMTRLSQMFEFSASHRLHNAQLSAEQNVKTYGKCNNPTGHGHNYQLQVTLKGTPKPDGLLVDVPAFEKIVADEVIAKLDHKHLNSDVPEFASVIPSVENIARVIYRMLVGRFATVDAELASVTVWETTKTWCEYSE